MLLLGESNIIFSILPHIYWNQAGRANMLGSVYLGCARLVHIGCWGWLCRQFSSGKHSYFDLQISVDFCFGIKLHHHAIWFSTAFVDILNIALSYSMLVSLLQQWGWRICPSWGCWRWAFRHLKRLNILQVTNCFFVWIIVS